MGVDPFFLKEPKPSTTTRVLAPFSGMTTSPIMEAYITRMGDWCYLRVSTSYVNLQKNASAGPIVVAGLAPGWLRPPNTVIMGMWGQYGGATRFLQARILASGDLNLYTETGANIPGGTLNCGVLSGTTLVWQAVAA